MTQPIPLPAPDRTRRVARPWPAHRLLETRAAALPRTGRATRARPRLPRGADVMAEAAGRSMRSGCRRRLTCALAYASLAASAREAVGRAAGCAGVRRFPRRTSDTAAPGIHRRARLAVDAPQHSRRYSTAAREAGLASNSASSAVLGPENSKEIAQDQRGRNRQDGEPVSRHMHYRSEWPDNQPADDFCRRMAVSTRPPTSVRRFWRPSCRNVSWVWSRPSKCRIVACQSFTWQRSSTAL
jgi:hypothetical protein